VKKTPVLYFPVNVVALKMFERPRWRLDLRPPRQRVRRGYAGAAYIIKNLGYKKIVFFGPAYAFGQDQWAGAKDAMKKYGVTAEYLESPVGTSDFTPYLTKVAEMKPDIVMLAHWGVDAINVLKQSYEIGLKKKTKIWFNWMTNVFGSGVPADALEGVYSLMSWYYDMTGFKDAEVVKARTTSTGSSGRSTAIPRPVQRDGVHRNDRGAPRGRSGAVDRSRRRFCGADEIAPLRNHEGARHVAADHQPTFKYGAFVVQGKGRRSAKIQVGPG